MTTEPGGPVFVAGLERSGTSLMYALLASHPEIAMTRRTNLWRYFYRRYGDLSDDRNLDACLDVMSRYKRLVKLDIDWARLRHDFRSGPPTYPRLFELLELQFAQRLGKPRWGDKSLMTERHAQQILAAYPGSRIIHMIRDPRDRYASVQKRWERRRGGAGVGVAQWRFSVRRAEKNARRWPESYLLVRYEDLVSDPVGQMKAVCAFLGVVYTDEMLSMQGADDFDEAGNSSYGRRRAGVISTDSIGRFREVLSEGQIRYIERAVSGPMQRLGYEPVRSSQSRSSRLWFTLVVIPLEGLRMFLWDVRDRVLDRVGRRIPNHRFVRSETGT